MLICASFVALKRSRVLALHLSDFDAFGAAASEFMRGLLFTAPF